MGYHPCSVEIYKKLKKLHTLYWKNVIKAAAAERWDRKLNKVGERPLYCPGVLVKKTYRKRRSAFKNYWGYDWESHTIRKLYLQAKKPVVMKEVPIDWTKLPPNFTEEQLTYILETLKKYEEFEESLLK